MSRRTRKAAGADILSSPEAAPSAPPTSPDHQVFAPAGMLALAPQAFGFMLFGPAGAKENAELGPVVVVDIDGPLDRRDDGWCDSYEAVIARVQAASETAARAIVLRVNCPGGEAAGCFDAARRIRQIAADSGKELAAYVDREALSGGYALASAASIICLGDAAFVGSIGVISARRDYSEGMARDGMRVAFITSGARKADGNPALPLSEAELASMQVLVDSTAQKFFELVADFRGLDVETIAGFEARTYHAEGAIAVGLADKVGSFEELVTELSSATGDRTMTKVKAEGDKSPYETARAALEEAAKGDDANAAAAKRALAAMDEQSPPGDDEEKKKKEGDGETKTESDKEPDGDEEKKPAAAASSQSTVAQLAATVDRQAKRLESLEQTNRVQRVSALLDARPDISATLRTFLLKQTEADVKEALAGIEAPKGPPAPITTVKTTRGATQADASAPRLSEADKQALDLRMGVRVNKPGVVQSSHKLQLGVLQPAPVEPPAQ